MADPFAQYEQTASTAATAEENAQQSLRTRAADKASLLHQALDMSHKMALMASFESTSPYGGAYDTAARKAVSNLTVPLRQQIARSSLSYDDLHSYFSALQTNAAKSRAQADYQAFVSDPASFGTVKGFGYGGKEIERPATLMDMQSVLPGLQDILSSTSTSLVNRGVKDIGNVLGSPLRAYDHLGRTFSEWLQQERGQGHGGFGHPFEVLKDLGNLPHDWSVTKDTPGNFGTLFARDFLNLKPGSIPYKVVAMATEFYGSAVTDPIVMATSLRGAIHAGEAAALEANPEFISHITSTPSFQRAAESISHMSNANVVRRYMQRLGGHVEPEVLGALADARTPEAVTQVFNDAHLGRNGFRVGSVASVPHQLPGWAGDAQAARAQMYQHPGMFRVLPERRFSVYDPKVLDEVQRTGGMFRLPNERIDDAVHDFIKADTAQDKLDVVRKLFDDGLEKIGLTKEQVGRLKGSQYLPFHEQDQLFGYNGERFPLQESQLQNSVRFPDYRLIRKAMAEIKGGGLPQLEKMDEILRKAQSPIYSIWLARPSRMMKIMLDEGLGNLAAKNITGKQFISRIGQSVATDLELSQHGWIRAMGEGLDHAIEGTAKLPGLGWLKSPSAEYVGIPEEISAAHYGTAKAFTGTGEFLPPEISRLEYKMNKELSKQGWAPDVGNWKYIDPLKDPNHFLSWYRVANHQVMNDRISQILLAYHDQPEMGMMFAREFLKSPEGVAYLKKMARSVEAVGGPEKLLQTQKALMERVIPPEIRDVAALEGHLDPETLSSIPLKDRPTVWGHPVIPASKIQGWGAGLERTADWSFHTQSRLIDSFIRRPIFREMQSQEFERTRNIAEQTGALGHTVSEEELGLAAANTASRKFLLQIHNPAERTLLDTWSQAFVPFGFAQIQFYKRWGRNLISNPGFVRQASLFMGAGEKSGWFERNDRGDLELNVPVAPELMNWLGQKVFGVPEKLNLFRDSFKVTISHHDREQGIFGLLTAGPHLLDAVAAPPGLPFSGHYNLGFAPVLSFGVNQMLRQRPGYEDITNFFGGEQPPTAPHTGFLQKVFGAIAPSWMDKLATAYSGDDGDIQWANANKEVLAWAAAHDYNIMDPKIQEKARGWTKALFTLRGLDQFFSPYTPTNNVPGLENLNLLRQYRTKYGREAGLMKFMDENPNLWAYTEAFSAKQKGAPAPTAEAQGFYDSHRGFYKDYPDVAQYFEPGNGAFDQAVYNQQITAGTRQVFTPKQWIQQIASHRGDDWYYNKVMPAYRQAQAQKANRADLSLWLAVQVENINSVYPGWKDWHHEWQKRQDAKLSDIASLQNLVSTDRYNKVPGFDGVKAFMLGYQQATAALHQAGVTDWTSKRADPTKGWMVSYYNSVQSKYNSDALKNVWAYLFRGTMQGYEDVNP